MDSEINISLEFFLTGIQFLTLWLLFYKLYQQELRAKRILLLFFILLFRPLYIILYGPFFPIHIILKIILPALIYIILIILAGGKKKNLCIMAVYHWNVTFLVDVIFSSMFLGITGKFLFSSNDLYMKANIIYYAIIFLWALFYYSVMRAIPQEAVNRTPLRIWLIILLTPTIGAVAYLTIRNPLLKQLESGINNFLYLGFFCIILLVLNLFMFYLFIKLISSYSMRLLAGELNNTPSLYTAQDGLSGKFIQKYNLSKRQVEIVEALLQGKSNKEIAILMDIKVNTVQVHLQNIYQKTGAPSRYALMALAGIGKQTSNSTK
jgi:DNA-binding CsgD family transcriptional regulator